MIRERVVPVGWLLVALVIVVGAALGYSPVASAVPSHDVDAYAADNGYIICQVLDDHPSFAGIRGVSQAIVLKGLSEYESGEVIALSIIGYCPRHLGLMQQFIRAYGDKQVVA